MRFVCERGDAGESVLLGDVSDEPCYQLCYMETGSVDMFVENRLVHLTGGELCVIPPGALIRVTGRSEFTNRRTAAAFTEDLLAPFIEACGRENVSPLISAGHYAVPAEKRARIEKILGELEAYGNAFNTDEGDVIDKFLKKNLFFELLAGLRTLEAPAPAPRTRRKDELREMIQNTVTAIYDGYGEHLCLSQFAGAAGMTQVHFSRKFYEFTGMKYKEYVIYVRMKAAKKMLRDTGEPISRISECCGFGGSSYYFSDAFKRIQGISPLKYREKARKGQPLQDFICSRSWRR